MVGNIRHRSQIVATPRYARQRTIIETRESEVANELARQMLEEGRELVSRRESGTRFTLEMPKGHPGVSQSNLMFSLLILASMYGLRADSYEGDTFAFMKLGAADDQGVDVFGSERTVFPRYLRS